MCSSSGGQNCIIQHLVSSHWNKWVVNIGVSCPAGFVIPYDCIILIQFYLGVLRCTTSKTSKSGTGVENTLSLTYPHKKKSRGGGDIRRLVRVSDHLSQFTCLEMLQPNVTINTWHNILETNLSNGKKKCLYSTCSSFLVINVCNQGKTLCSPCIWCENSNTKKFWGIYESSGNETYHLVWLSGPSLRT